MGQGGRGAVAPGVPTPATLPMAGLCCCTNTESPPLQCVLKGYWTNNEKHTLVIGPVDQQGRFNGKYIIDKPYPLRGFQHGTNQNSQILELEFTVYWSSGASPFAASLLCSQSSPDPSNVPNALSSVPNGHLPSCLPSSL